MTGNAVDFVIDWVLDEIERQDGKWGEQSHPLVHDRYGQMREDYYFRANRAKLRNDDLVKQGAQDWANILLEEVYEALAEPHALGAIEELVQVAAVAIQAILSIEANGINGRQKVAA